MGYDTELYYLILSSIIVMKIKIYMGPKVTCYVSRGKMCSMVLKIGGLLTIIGQAQWTGETWNVWIVLG